MHMEHIQLKLLAAEPIEIPDCGSMHIPKVREIVQIGEPKYNQLLSVLLFEKELIASSDANDLSNFDFLFANCYQNNEFLQICLDAFEMMFKRKLLMCDVRTSTEPFFYFEDGNGNINRNNFEQIQSIVRIGNHVKIDNSDDTYNPANEVTAKIIAEMIERKKRKPKPKPVINLHSMISGMAWKSGVPELARILDLTMYQFYDGYKRIENVDSVHYTLFGIYTGNVDTKKINTRELNFAKIIDNN